MICLDLLKAVVEDVACLWVLVRGMRSLYRSKGYWELTVVAAVDDDELVV